MLFARTAALVAKPTLRIAARARPSTRLMMSEAPAADFSRIDLRVGARAARTRTRARAPHTSQRRLDRGRVRPPRVRQAHHRGNRPRRGRGVVGAFRRGIVRGRRGAEGCCGAVGGGLQRRRGRHVIGPRGRVAATPRVPRPRDGSRRRRGCRVDRPFDGLQRRRGCRVDRPSRRRRRGWIVRLDESRRRRGVPRGSSDRRPPQASPTARGRSSRASARTTPRRTSWARRCWSWRICRRPSSAACRRPAWSSAARRTTRPSWRSSSRPRTPTRASARSSTAADPRGKPPNPS